MQGQRSRGWLPELLVQVAVRYPFRVLLVWAAILFLGAFGVSRVHIDTTTDSVLDTGGSSWVFYKSSQGRFGGDEIVVVALPGRLPFERQVLKDVERLTRELELVEGVQRVDSLASVPLIRVESDGRLQLSPAIDGSRGVKALQGLVAKDRIAPRILISEDGRVAALNVILEREFSQYDKAVSEIQEIVDMDTAWISGVPVFRREASARTRREVILFVPITVLAIGFLISVAYRSLKMAAIALTVGAAGSWLMTAAMGATGVSLSLVTMILPSIMLALGCAYVMHILSAAHGCSDFLELEDRLRRVALPVLLSCLTTAIGFAAIGTIGIDEVRAVGGFGALGALVLGVASLTLAPAMLTQWCVPFSAQPTLAWEGKLVRGLLKIADKRRRAVFVLWSGALLAAVLGISRIEVVTDATQWFPPGDSVRDQYDSIGGALSGISPVNVVVESRGGRSALEPDVLSAIDGLSAFLGSLDQVGKAISICDPLRQIHGGFLEDESMPLPIGGGEAEQYLVLLESVDQVADLIAEDRQSANILLRVNDNGSEAILDVEESAAGWWAKNGPRDFEIRTTGIMYEFARAQDEISFGQIRGLLLALGVIGIVIFLALRDLPLAVVSMVPNLVPTVMVFGVMGWAGIPLDAGTVIVGSLSLGVAVDDTVHLVSRFHEDMRGGADPVQSLEGALAAVIHPIVLTTVVLVVGFGLIGLSGFVLTRNLGLLLAGVASVCLLADLILLPALLVAVRFGPRASLV